MKLVYWPLMDGLLHLVQQSAQSPRRCTNCNSPPINGQYTNHCIANGPLRCGFNVPIKRLTVVLLDTCRTSFMSRGRDSWWAIIFGLLYLFFFWWYCVCYHCNVAADSCICRSETSTIEDEWLRDHNIKFAQVAAPCSEAWGEVGRCLRVLMHRFRIL